MPKRRWSRHHQEQVVQRKLDPEAVEAYLTRTTKPASISSSWRSYLRQTTSCPITSSWRTASPRTTRRSGFWSWGTSRPGSIHRRLWINLRPSPDSTAYLRSFSSTTVSIAIIDYKEQKLTRPSIWCTSGIRWRMWVKQLELICSHWTNWRTAQKFTTAISESKEATSTTSRLILLEISAKISIICMQKTQRPESPISIWSWSKALRATDKAPSRWKSSGLSTFSEKKI